MRTSVITGAMSLDARSHIPSHNIVHFVRGCRTFRARLQDFVLKRFYGTTLGIIFTSPASSVRRYVLSGCCFHKNTTRFSVGIF